MSISEIIDGIIILAGPMPEKKVTVKVVHENYALIANNVGILTKVCECGYKSKGFRDLTADKCPECGIVFKKKEK